MGTFNNIFYRINTPSPFLDIAVIFYAKTTDGGGATIVSTRSSPSRSCRSASCARNRSSCSCYAGAATAGGAEKERRGMRRSVEGRLSVIK